jgi:putative oxidoreductase
MPRLGAGLSADSHQGLGSNMQQLEKLEKFAPYMLSILRIVTGVIFMEHGLQKHLAFPARAAGAKAPDLLSLQWFAGAIEIVGGILIIFGLFTRPVAFLLSGEMAFAYWMAHAPRNVFPVLNGGDAAILYCFVFLYIFFAGGGPWSVDRIWRKAN